MWLILLSFVCSIGVPQEIPDYNYKKKWKNALKKNKRQLRTNRHKLRKSGAEPGLLQTKRDRKRNKEAHKLAKKQLREIRSEITGI